MTKNLKPAAASLVLAAAFALTCSSARALPESRMPPPNQVLSNGDNTIVTGVVARVDDTPIGTYVFIDRPASVRRIAAFIPWGGRNAFPELDTLKGVRVQIYGPIGMWGWPLVIMTDPDQLTVIP